MQSRAFNKLVFALPQKIGLLLFFILAFQQLKAAPFAEQITLSLKNVSLERAFREIQKQTSYRFIYTKEEIRQVTKISIEVKNASLETVLDHCFKDQPLSYTIDDSFVIITFKKNSATAVLKPEALDIYGKVVNRSAEPLPGVSVVVKGSQQFAITDNLGEFKILQVSENAILQISSVGYSPLEVPVDSRQRIIIELNVAVQKLDETVIIGYGTTSRRTATGSVGKLYADEIASQPVTNPLAALSGRIPGLLVTQSSGIAGSSFKVEIRGRNSITQGSSPLFIIDGIPFGGNNASINQLSSAIASSAGQGLSAFNSINSLDIESIEVLKDADATAIYGSRGANGVVLITTRKATPGKTRFTFSATTGASRITSAADMMHTTDYINMRKEAFTNDNVLPSAGNAPDLVLWDTSRFTDFKKTLIGGTAWTTDILASLSAGQSNTQFLLSGGYHQESTVYPGNLSDKRFTLHSSLTHSSTDKRFKTTLTTTLGFENNKINSTDLASFLSLPPNLPSLYDSSGKLNWQMGGANFDNPLAYLLREYSAVTENLLSNLQLQYRVFKGFVLKSSFGFNSMKVQETAIVPKNSQNPQFATSGSSQFGNNNIKSWIIEPQAEYTTRVLEGKLTLLTGATFQQNAQTRSSITATGYSNDALLRSVSGAGSTIVRDNFNQYRYQALFARLNYNWKDKYLVNISGRRDGSSRFGIQKQFANFGAVGAGWVLSGEPFLKNSILSFAKIRGSYGTTGNDQIGDYQYLDAWSSSPFRYQGASMIPSRLYNPDYGWEKNSKWEAAIELGFFEDRFYLSAAYFLSRSNNQLVNYSLPAQTGFSSIIMNFPALVQNHGLELLLESKNISGNNLHWSTSFNITIPKNQLKSFPGLANSSYAYSYVEGKSLNTVYAYHLLGVDPASGIYKVEDVNKDGKIGGVEDYTSLYNLDPEFYGGLSNNLSFKNWQLTVFLEFRKQMGFNFNNYPYNNFAPGRMFNLPGELIDRWKQPGDLENIQKVTATPFTAAFDGQYLYSLSDGRITNASFLRLKNISLAYTFENKLIKKLHLESLQLYARAQNIFTITPYEGGDPETQNLFRLPL